MNYKICTHCKQINSENYCWVCKAVTKKIGEENGIPEV
jgi:RNA polymerase subunit RPABC4/transcription elongation factor Spt4